MWLVFRKTYAFSWATEGEGLWSRGSRQPNSQNHRVSGVGRDLCGPSSPTPLPKQGHLQQAAEDLVQVGFEYLQRRRLHKPPLGSLFQCSVTLRVKKFFLMFRWNFLCFSFCLLPLVLSLGTTGKSLAPSSWHPPCRYVEAFKRGTGLTPAGALEGARRKEKLSCSSRRRRKSCQSMRVAAARHTRNAAKVLCSPLTPDPSNQQELANGEKKTIENHKHQFLMV